MSGPVTISSGEMSAAIAPLGAELLSWRDAEGREYMTDGDPAWWPGHAPVLFPIVGALADDTYRLDGREYPLPRHGFARRSVFEMVERQPGSVRFRLADSEASRAAYPFAFALEMHFALSGQTLAMTATIANPGEAELPFSFGFHPAFAWPVPGGGDALAHRIVFARPEPAPIRRLDGAGLLAASEPSPVDGRELAPHPELFAADAMIWDDLVSDRLVYRGENGLPALEMTFPDTPCLGIWQKPGAPFLAIEPWAGHADPAGFEGDLRDKPGVMRLAPGATRSFRMDVTLRRG